MFNKLLSASSMSNHGTLIQIKNNFGHRNVTSDVMKCFNYAENFVRLVETLFVFTTNRSRPAIALSYTVDVDISTLSLTIFSRRPFYVFERGREPIGQRTVIILSSGYN